MSDENLSTSGLVPNDFRAHRSYLPDEAFALVEGEYGGATDLIPEEHWNGLLGLATDVLLRTSDQCGTQLTQLHRLWGRWVETMPPEPKLAPYMFDACLDASDDFYAAVFTAAHGFYRQGMANLRSALEGLAIAAHFAVRKDQAGCQQWRSDEIEPKFGNVRDMLKPSLGTAATDAIKELYKTLSGYIHSGDSTASAQLWGGSNGPVFEPDSFQFVYGYFRDVMAIGYALLALGWPAFMIPDWVWRLFERPGGVWGEVSIHDLKAQLQHRSGANSMEQPRAPGERG